MVMNFSPAPRW